MSQAATTITELVSALEAIENGEIERPLGKPWRADGTSSKLDLCIHDVPMHACCEACIDAHARTALSNTRGDTKNDKG